MTTTSEVLRALIPSPEAEEASYPPAFRRISELLLNQTTLRISGEPHRFTEIEFYFKGHEHQDKFTHCDAMQRRFGSWYFHRTGGEYRGGTYKGLDVTFGDGEAFGGILIRGIERLDDRDYIDGPCMFVDHALRLTEKTSVAALAESFDRSIDHAEGSPLSLEPSEDRRQEIFATPRIGLSLKRGNNEERQRFIGRHYRFLSEPKRCRKGKLHLAVALYQQGRALADICRVTEAREAVVKGYLEGFEAGKSRDFSTLGSELSTRDTCELFGACSRFG